MTVKYPSERVLIGAALAACLPCFLFPLSNPDIFWHLSAAKRILELGAIPSYEWLSEWKAGAEWIDFEWLPQLMFLGLHHLGGMVGLWIFKIALLILAAFVSWKTLEVHHIPVMYRALALALWAAAQLTRSDIRPELFSLVGFGLVLLALEMRRLGQKIPGPGWAIPFFCLWANLHLGLAYGMLLIGVYASGEWVEQSGIWKPRIKSAHGKPGLWKYLLAATAGTVINPFGFKLYMVLWRHWREMGSMAAYISEWGSIHLNNPWHWPYWIILFFGFGSALICMRRNRHIALGPLAALLYCGYSASEHARLAGYYVTLGLPLGFYWLKSSHLLPQNPVRWIRWSCLSAVILCAAFSVWAGRSFGLGARIFNDRSMPIQTADFLQSERAALTGRTLYNEWGWGGYLAYRLYPDYRIFQDGRYIFHPLLAEEESALDNPDSWQKFLDHYGVDLALLQNNPDYSVYMPKDRWALVHFDDKALVFVRRAVMPQKWLESREKESLSSDLSDAERDGKASNPVP